MHTYIHAQQINCGPKLRKIGSNLQQNIIENHQMVLQLNSFNILKQAKIQPQIVILHFFFNFSIQLLLHLLILQVFLGNFRTITEGRKPLLKLKRKKKCLVPKLELYYSCHLILVEIFCLSNKIRMDINSLVSGKEEM